MAGASDATVPVVVVGAGPTGVVAATLLAQHGVECLLIDRFPEAYPQPRAVHLDDEVYRILARLGVGEGFARISRPMLGLRLVDGAGRRLAEFPRPPGTARHGYPQANLFDQPELEALLRANLRMHPRVTAEFGTALVGLRADGAAVRLDLLDREGRRRSIATRYVLGCDGANSLVRRSMGARLRDLRFAQRWLVVDIETDAGLDTWDGVHQVCDAERPATFMRIGPRRYRWEFRMADDERVGDFADLTALRPLLLPWIAGLPLDALRLVRVSDYTFRAAVADRWRCGRVLLLGDAAHLTPPFTGQGLGAGLRDAHNLAWKLAAVLQDRTSAAVLDTYQAEREPHVRSLIRLARIVGAAMTAGGRAGDVVRHAVAPRLHLVPGLRARALDSATPRLRRTSLVGRSVPGLGLAGTLCPNVQLTDGRRFDELANGRFVLVTARPPTAVQRADAEARGALVLTVQPASQLGDWLRRHRAGAALVRPDSVVVRAARRPEPLLTALEQIVTPEAPLALRSGERTRS